MRKLSLSLALIAGAVTPALAQSWQPEIGIRGGFASVDFTDLDQTLTVWDVPGAGGILSGAGIYLADAPLYAVIPWGERMAFQPTFGFQTIAVTGTTLTTASLGVRVNYALSPDFYVAAGPTAYIVKSNGLEDTQGAIEGAVGYRRPIGAGLRLHAEAFYQAREKSELVAKSTVLGLRVGAGASLGGGGGRAARGRSDALWTRGIGIQGGWTLQSFPGSADFSYFTLPFPSGSIMAGELPPQGPSALFAIIPMGERLALEPSADIHHFKAEGGDPITSYAVGAKLNYAFTRSAYAGAGMNYSTVSADAIDDGSSLAWVVAAGLRFPLVGRVMGRTEFNYRFFDETDILPSGQATSFVFGVIAPID